MGSTPDLHLELSDPDKGKSADRVIVEIPQEYTGTRDGLLALLPERERLRITNARPNSKGNYRPVTLRSPLRIRVTGYAFYDAYHYLVRWQTSKPSRCDFSPEQLHQRGRDHGTCNVGTIWELHPVWRKVARALGATAGPPEFSVENVREFADFCVASGGFEIS